MKKIGHMWDLENITISNEVVFVIGEALAILGTEYMEDRDADREGMKNGLF